MGIQFGLTEVERAGHHALLRCGYEPYSLELIGRGEPGHDHTAFELRRDVSLDDAAAISTTTASTHEAPRRRAVSSPTPTATGSS